MRGHCRMGPVLPPLLKQARLCHSLLKRRSHEMEVRLQSEQKSAELMAMVAMSFAIADNNFTDVASNLHHRLRPVESVCMPIFSYYNNMQWLMASCSAFMIVLLSELAENVVGGGYHSCMQIACSVPLTGVVSHMQALCSRSCS